MKRSPVAPGHASRFSWPAVLLLVTLSGCGTDPLAPPPLATDPALESRARDHEGRGFFPLATGNRWSYRGTDTVDDGTNPPTAFDYRFDYHVLGKEPRGGREYAVIEVRLFLPPFEEPFLGRLLLRQDRAGLYQRVLPVERVTLALEDRGRSPAFGGAANSEAPAWRSPALPGAALEALRQSLAPRLTSLPGLGADHRRRGGPADSELVVLRYPLHRGARWAPSPGAPRIVVVSHDRLRLPAGRFEGWRLRIPDEAGHYEWYGRAGFLKETAIAEIVVVDPQGNPVAITVRSRVVLVSLSLR